MISLRTEIKMKLKCNICNDAIIEEECNIQYKAERYSLIVILSSVLFWVMSFWQINYAVRMMFCNINSAVTVIKQAFSIKFINNSSSAAWESEVQKDSISLLKRLSKYNHIYMQWQSFCCCLFYTIILFRMCISSLLCKHFVNRFILRHLCFSYSVFFFVLFCFCISFQQSKYVNDVIYSICYILN